jgi:hypothetical protein
MSTHIFSTVPTSNFIEPSKTILDTLKELRVDTKQVNNTDNIVKNNINFDYEKIRYNSHC